MKYYKSIKKRHWCQFTNSNFDYKSQYSMTKSHSQTQKLYNVLSESHSHTELYHNVLVKHYASNRAVTVPNIFRLVLLINAYFFTSVMYFKLKIHELNFKILNLLNIKSTFWKWTIWLKFKCIFHKFWWTTVCTCQRPWWLSVTTVYTRRNSL